MAKITDQLKKELKGDCSAVQGYVPTTLRDDVIAQMKADKRNGIKTTWDNLLEACLRVYLGERQSKRAV